MTPPSLPDAARRVPLPLLLLVAAIAATAYLPSLGNGFAYDDVPVVVEHEELHDLSRLPERLASPYWPNQYGRLLGLWRPVTTSTLAVQWAAWDGDPAGFHAVNLLLHALVTLLVTLLLARIIPVAGAVAGGAVFALHPVHVEAVANVVGLAEILSAAFVLGACLVHLRGREREGRREEGAPGWNGPDRSGPDRSGPDRSGPDRSGPDRSGPDRSGGRRDAEGYGSGRVAWIGLLYLLAFLSKEGAVVLPALLFLLDAYLDRLRPGVLRGYLRRRLGLYLTLAGVAAVVFLGRWIVLGSVADPAAPFAAIVLTEIPRVWTVLGTWPHYLRLLLFPADLSVDYAPLVIPVLHGWTAASIAGLALGLGLLGGALWLWRRVGPGVAGPPVVALLWFVVTVLPVSNLLFLSGVLLAERTLYLPSVAVALAAGWLVARLWPDPLAAGDPAGRLGTVVMAGIVVWTGWLGVRTVSRIPVWESTDTVLRNLIEEHPESARAQWLWGDMLAQAGREEAAVAHLRLATRIMGTREYQFLTAVGRRMRTIDRPDLAELYFRFAVDDEPDAPDAHQFLAVLYQDQERWAEAEAAARRALATADTRAMHHLLATALEEQGRWTEAVPHRRTAAERSGDDWQWWSWLARSEREAGALAAACRSFDEALRRTDDPDAVRALDSLRADVAGRAGSGCVAD